MSKAPLINIILLTDISYGSSYDLLSHLSITKMERAYLFTYVTLP
jgi:hypothetical protein